MTAIDPPGRPLRRDAQRNLERIRVAAIEVFGERGLDASHEAIARRADVSIGTVYRRFPDREQLIDLVFEDGLDKIVAMAEDAKHMDDPAVAITHLLERILEATSENLGLGQLLGGSAHGAQRVERARARLEPLVLSVVERARRAGAIRPDAEPQDLPLILLMLNTLAEAGRGIAPDVWRRYLALLIAGLRAAPAEAGPLPPAVSVEDVDRVVKAAHGA
ncbi:MAG TPA: helix-turn-helix domain-containing protein [Baekduia sp.]|nr:helix-turn-helix domain-containing protein [Baekduia sp.]